MQKKYLTFLIILFVFTACNKKNIWKEPTDVGFKINIKKTDIIDKRFNFTDGTIIIAEFEFEGEREQADDVYFSKSFPGGLNIDFDPDTPIPELDFDIPQGTYTGISVAFDTFDDLGYNNIVVNGTYTNPEGEKLPLRFEFRSGEYFVITAEDYSGNSQIILDADIPASATIVLNPVYWFQKISSSLMNDAVLTEINGKETILINDTVNENIFDIVADRLDESTETVFITN